MNNVLLYLATVAIWGSSWLAITWQLGRVAPEVSIFYRMAASSALLIGWCLARRLPLRFSLEQHLWMALQGVLLFSANYIIFYFATFYLTSGLVAVAFSTIVIMNIAFGAFLLRSPVRPRVTLGAVVGLAGLMLVFWPDLAAFDTNSARPHRARPVARRNRVGLARQRGLGAQPAGPHPGRPEQRLRHGLWRPVHARRGARPRRPVRVRLACAPTCCRSSTWRCSPPCSASAAT